MAPYLSRTRLVFDFRLRGTPSIVFHDELPSGSTKEAVMRRSVLDTVTGPFGTKAVEE